MMNGDTRKQLKPFWSQNLRTFSNLYPIQGENVNQFQIFDDQQSNQDHLKQKNIDIKQILGHDEEIEELPKLPLDNREENWEKFQIDSFVDDEQYIPEKNKVDSKQTFLVNGQTKNIPKNFGKQIIKFVKDNKKFVRQLLKRIKSKVNYTQLNAQLQRKKKKMNKIEEMKGLWKKQSIYGRQMRIISENFFRKRGYSWIFNSRITSFQSHLKYRVIVRRILRDPHKKQNLKSDY